MVALLLSLLDERGSHLVSPAASKSTRLFAMRELSSLSPSKASLNLSSSGELSSTAKSNLSRQFSVCQAAEPAHRFNLFSTISPWVNQTLPLCMCLVATGIACEHLPWSSASFPSLIECFRHLSDPPSSVSHRKARTFEHRSCHSLSSCTLGGNLGATRFIQSARSAQMLRVGLVMDISALGVQRRNLAIYRKDLLVSIKVNRISLNFLKATGSAVLFMSSSIPIVGGTIPPWATCGETLALLFSNSNQLPQSLRVLTSALSGHTSLLTPKLPMSQHFFGIGAASVST